MIVEDLLTGNVYSFVLQDELIRNSECDGWKEIPVRVEDESTETAGSVELTKDDDQKQTDSVGDSDITVAETDDRDASVAAATAAEPTAKHHTVPQLSGFCLLICTVWYTGWHKKVSHCHVSSLNRIKNRH